MLTENLRASDESSIGTQSSNDSDSFAKQRHTKSITLIIKLIVRKHGASPLQQPVAGCLYGGLAKRQNDNGSGSIREGILLSKLHWSDRFCCLNTLYTKTATHAQLNPIHYTLLPKRPKLGFGGHLPKRSKLWSKQSGILTMIEESWVDAEATNPIRWRVLTTLTGDFEKSMDHLSGFGVRASSAQLTEYSE